MGASASVTCAVCKQVCTSPRFLPCQHSFCLNCLEELEKSRKHVVVCPVCRRHGAVPPGGVSNFPTSPSLIQQELRPSDAEGCEMCPVHTKDRVTLHCTQCDQVLCIVCKVTKHEGHVTEALSEAADRCKGKIEKELRRVDRCIRSLEDQSLVFEKKEQRVREERDAVTEKIQSRYEAVVAMAAKYRDEALKDVQEMSVRAEQELAVRAQPVDNELNSLLQLQERARKALSTACGVEVLQVEKEMTRRRGQNVAERAGKLDQTGHLDTADHCGLHHDLTDDFISLSKETEKHIKRYIQSLVKQNL